MLNHDVIQFLRKNFICKIKQYVQFLQMYLLNKNAVKMKNKFLSRAELNSEVKKDIYSPKKMSQTAVLSYLAQLCGFVLSVEYDYPSLGMFAFL